MIGSTGVATVLGVDPRGSGDGGEDRGGGPSGTEDGEHDDPRGRGCTIASTRASLGSGTMARMRMVVVLRGWRRGSARAVVSVLGSDTTTRIVAIVVLMGRRRGSACGGG